MDLGQVGQGLKQPGIVEGVPAYGKGVKWGEFSCPFQPKAIP